MSAMYHDIYQLLLVILRGLVMTGFLRDMALLGSGTSGKESDT